MRTEYVAPASMQTPRENSRQGVLASLKMRSAFFLLLTASLLTSVLSGCSDENEGTADPTDAQSDESEPFIANMGESSALGYLDMPEMEPTTEEPLVILEAMIAAYQAADSYYDSGLLQLWRAPNNSAVEPELLFSGDHTIFMERPNRIRVAVGDARIVSDGESMVFQTAMIPGQLLTMPAPEEMTLTDIFPEAILLEAMSMQELTAPLSWVPLQLVLFFADDPIRTLAPEGVELSVEVPGVATGRPCDRVSVFFPGWGRVVYWIERETRNLLRVEIPPSHFAPSPEDADQLALILEPRDAEFNIPFEDAAFQFAGPEGLEIVERFSFPSTKLLGQKIEGLSFQNLDDETVNMNDFAGSITVIAFWSPQSPIDRATLQLLDSLRNRYQGRGEVDFLAVNIDDPDQTRDETIQGLLDEWAVEIPLLRDPNGEIFATMLGGDSIPSIVILDQDSRYQASFTGDTPAFVTESCLPAIEMILGGDNLFEEIQTQLESNHTAFLEFRDNSIDQNIFGWFAPEEESSADPSATASENGDPEAVDPEAVDPQETETADVPPLDFDLPELFVPEMVYSVPNSQTDEELFLWDQLLPLKNAAFDAVSIRKTEDAFFLAGLSQGESTEEIEILREQVVSIELPVEGNESDSETESDQTSEAIGEIPPILRVKPEYDPEGQRTRLILFQTLTQKASILNEQLETIAVHELTGNAGFIDAILMSPTEGEEADLFVSHFSPATGKSKIVRTTLSGEQRWECELPAGMGPMFLQMVVSVEDRPVAIYATNGDIAFNITLEEGIHTEHFPVVPGTAGRVFNEWLLTQNLHPTIQQGETAKLPGTMRILALPQLSYILAVSFDATGRILWRTRLPDGFSPAGEPSIFTLPETNEPCWLQFGNLPEMGFLLFDRDGTIFAQGQTPASDGVRLIGTWDGRPAVYVWRNEDQSVWTLKAPETEEAPAEEPDQEAVLPVEPE